MASVRCMVNVMIPLGSGALIQCCMEPDVGRVPKFEVRLFPFYNFKCLTGRGNRKCNFVWEVLNFVHIWGTENFRLDKQTLWFQWNSGNRKSSSRCRSINVAPKSQANLNLRSIQKFQVFKYAGGSRKCKTPRLLFFLRSLAYIAVGKVDNVGVRQSLSGGLSTDARHVSEEIGRSSLENVMA